MVLTLAATASPQTAEAGPASIPVHNLTIDRLAGDALHTLAQQYHVVIGIYGAIPPGHETDSVRPIHVSLNPTFALGGVCH
jgi:hypothetical protein